VAEPTNRGSFNHYLHNSGGFVTAIAEAIARADEDNLARLSLAYPQMVAAHSMHNWDMVPDDFDSKLYNASPAVRILADSIGEATKIGCGRAGCHCQQVLIRMPNPSLAMVKPEHILFCLTAEDIRSRLEELGTFPNLVDAMMSDEGFIRLVKKGIESGLGEAQWDYVDAAIRNTDWQEPNG